VGFWWGGGGGGGVALLKSFQTIVSGDITNLPYGYTCAESKRCPTTCRVVNFNDVKCLFHVFDIEKHRREYTITSPFSGGFRFKSGHGLSGLQFT